ncbi:MAG: UvrD-helicase domain-containing protein, partial [bacterium]|nr:UvrD-helicase domain-containing protein [bacterium]
MILLAVKLLRGDEELRRRIRRRFGYLLVDEFQDTNHAQISLILEINGGNLTAVGDEDQSIYRWRGAELNNILHFEGSFPGAVVRKLERNYRSTQTILDASGALIANNVDRRGKTLWTEAGGGEKLALFRAADEQDEARWVVDTFKGLEHRFALGAMAVLVRTNAQTRSFEEEFLRRRVPYTLVGGLRFYERAEIKDLIAYLRLLRNPHDLFSFNRILNRPARGIGKATHQLLLARAAQLSRAVWDVLVADDLDGIPLRGARALGRFRDLMLSLIDEASRLPLPALLDRLLEVTSYTDLYDKGDDDSRARLENIGELRTAVREFTETQPAESGGEDLLTAFLDHASLVSGDEVAGGQSVSLMTLHSAKGLEFSAVVVAGLEEDLLPHFNAATLPAEVEEERRLLYVGMTRAEKRLLLTTCRRRRVAGTYQDRDESRFLTEIPGRFLETEESSELLSRRREPRPGEVDNIYSFFGRERRSAGGAAGEGTRDREVPSAQPAREERPRRGGRLRRGSRVRHAKLGIGKVLSIEGSGDEMRVNVYFDGVGRRKLIVRYAN